MKNTKLAFAAAVLTASLTACASAPPPRLVIHPDMDQAAVFAVDGLKNRYWGKRLTFGPYHTEKTRVGETWSWSVGLFGPQFGAHNQPYRFEFVDDAGDRYRVECRAKTPILRRATRSSEWTFPLGETRLSCGIQDPAGNVASIVLHGIAGDFSGETGFADLEDFEISALRSFAGAKAAAPSRCRARSATSCAKAARWSPPSTPSASRWSTWPRSSSRSSAPRRRSP